MIRGDTALSEPVVATFARPMTRCQVVVIDQLPVRSPNPCGLTLGSFGRFRMLPVSPRNRYRFTWLRLVDFTCLLKASNRYRFTWLLFRISHVSYEPAQPVQIHLASFRRFHMFVMSPRNPYRFTWLRFVDFTVRLTARTSHTASLWLRSAAFTGFPQARTALTNSPWLPSEKKVHLWQSCESGGPL